MQLWQLDIVGGVPLPSGREAKPVTGIDDHSRFAVAIAVVTDRHRGSGPALGFDPAGAAVTVVMESARNAAACLVPAPRRHRDHGPTGDSR
jgi:hypothetical protein